MSRRSPLYYGAQSLGSGLERAFGGLGMGMQNAGQSIGRGIEQGGRDMRADMKQKEAEKKLEAERARQRQLEAAKVESQLAYDEDLGQGAGGMSPPPGYQRQHVEDKLRSKYKGLRPEEVSMLSGGAELSARDRARTAQAEIEKEKRGRQQRFGERDMDHSYEMELELLRQEGEKARGTGGEKPFDLNKHLESRRSFFSENILGKSVNDVIISGQTELTVPVVEAQSRDYLNLLGDDVYLDDATKASEIERTIRNIGASGLPGFREMSERLTRDYLGASVADDGGDGTETVMGLDVPPGEMAGLIAHLKATMPNASNEEMRAEAERYLLERATPDEASESEARAGLETVMGRTVPSGATVYEDTPAEKAYSSTLIGAAAGVAGGGDDGDGDIEGSSAGDDGAPGEMDGDRKAIDTGNAADIVRQQLQDLAPGEDIPGVTSPGFRVPSAPTPPPPQMPASPTPQAPPMDPRTPEQAAAPAPSAPPVSIGMAPAEFIDSQPGWRITSRGRSPQRNAMVGGSMTSRHLSGRARDIGATDRSTPQAAVNELAAKAMEVRMGASGLNEVTLEIPRRFRRQVTPPDGVDVSWIADAANGSPTGIHLHVSW